MKSLPKDVRVASMAPRPGLPSNSSYGNLSQLGSAQMDVRSASPMTGLTTVPGGFPSGLPQQFANLQLGGSFAAGSSPTSLKNTRQLSTAGSSPVSLTSNLSRGASSGTLSSDELRPKSSSPLTAPDTSSPVASAPDIWGSAPSRVPKADISEERRKDIPYKPKPIGTREHTDMPAPVQADPSSGGQQHYGYGGRLR